MTSTQQHAPLARPLHAYLLLLCGCMSVLAAVVIAPILPKMQTHFAGVERVEFLVPLVLTAPGLVIAALSLFIGAVADKVGRKRLLVAALVAYAAFGVSPLWIDSLHTIFATRIGVGLAEAVIMTCCTALIGDYFRGVQRERYLALNTTFASTSAVIFIAVGGALGEFGWRVPFGVYAISLLLAPLTLWLLWEPAKRRAANVVQAVDADELPWSARRQLGICGVTLAGGIAFMAVQVHIAYLLQSVGVVSSTQVGLIASLAQLAVVVGSLLFRSVLRRGLGTSARLGLAFGIVACGYLLAGSAYSMEQVTGGAVLTGIGCGILMPTLQVWNMNNLPQSHRALGTGAWMAAFFLGQFLTPLVVVGLAGYSGGIAAAIKLMGALLAPVALLLLLLASRQRSAAASSIRKHDKNIRPLGND
ncbi:MFS transporter [Vogesella facilis]|uniref:MFS transporter n=1 Tax=Vogesella facilis TaxID=1655232 RepID=A0ABV7RAJ9_9NEIS